MRCEGRIHTFEDHIDTDVILPTQYMGNSDPEHLAQGCFAKVYPEFRELVQPGDIIIAGENFGCGSSREHAPIAIKATGIACVVASSFARVFYRSAINIGLPVVACPAAEPLARAGERAAVDFEAGVVEVGGKLLTFPTFPDQVMAILQAGGLVPFMTQRIAAGVAGRRGGDDHGQP